MNNDSSSQSTPDSQTLLNQIVLDYMKDKKRNRRFRLFKRILIACLLILLLVLCWRIFTSQDLMTKPHVGVIDISGEMSDSKAANADDFSTGMHNAYKNSGLKALIIRINSPGGSPVQAEYMYNTVLYYKNKHPNIKIYAVCVDACASAAYYVAVGADTIYASPASMVGSIGVLYNGFGFTDLMQKIGISRRLQTSGVNKGLMDPFSPEIDAQKQKLQVMIDIVHKQFINRVKTGRGNRLKIDDDTFSGLFWTGEQALAIGLIDGFGSSGQVAREVVKINKTVDYTNKQNLFDRMSKNLGTAMADELPASLGMVPGLLLK
ncbi:MAG: S49 family peptidase [Legionella sp.]|nr:S49 family peptidase [Legionella sp.]